MFSNKYLIISGKIRWDMQMCLTYSQLPNDGSTLEALVVSSTDWIDTDSSRASLVSSTSSFCPILEN